MAVAELYEYGAHADDVTRALHAALDEIDSLGLGALDIDHLEHVAVELLRAGERLRALTARTVVECDNAGLAPRNGSVGSTNAYLASHTHGPTSGIAPRRALGLWLRDFPELSAAWAAGEITEDHLRELRRAHYRKIHQCMVNDQQLHIDAARTLQFSDWLNHLAYWLLAVDPDGRLDEKRKASYGLRFRTDRNGDVHIQGVADPLTGEALMTMVEHEAGKVRRAEQADAEAEAPRPIKQHYLQGLMQVAKRGFRRADGSFPTPLINIVMSEKVAEDLISRMFDGDEHNPYELPLDFFDVDKRCETIRGTPIDPRRAGPALLIGRLRRQVMTAKRRKTNLGHDVRLFRSWQKIAALVETRGQCATTGCDNPYAWLQADHIHPHSKGTPTALEECQPLCEPCNLRKGDR